MLSGLSVADHGFDDEEADDDEDGAMAPADVCCADLDARYLSRSSCGIGHCPPDEATIFGGAGLGGAGCAAADVLPLACIGQPGGGVEDEDDAAEEEALLMDARISSRC